jgi:hypothetical protein
MRPEAASPYPGPGNRVYGRETGAALHPYHCLVAPRTSGDFERRPPNGGET